MLYTYIYIQKGQCEQIFVELRLKGAFLQLGPYIQKASNITSPPSTDLFSKWVTTAKKARFFWFRNPGCWTPKSCRLRLWSCKNCWKTPWRQGIPVDFPVTLPRTNSSHLLGTLPKRKPDRLPTHFRVRKNVRFRLWYLPTYQSLPRNPQPTWTFLNHQPNPPNHSTCHQGTGQFTIFNSCNTAEAIAAPSKVAVPRLETNRCGLQAAQGPKRWVFLSFFWGWEICKKPRKTNMTGWKIP